MKTLSIVSKKRINSTLLFLIFLVLANSLMLTRDGSLLRVIGVLIILLLPGLAWSGSLYFIRKPLVQWVVGFGLSYSLIVIAGLMLHYIPGAISFWSILLLFNALTVLAVIVRVARKPKEPSSDFSNRTVLLALLVILIFGSLFLFVNLGYSEFDGDESKVLIPAAEALEGQYESLFSQRKKGPGELLLPMLVWRLSTVVNESNARLPFALAGLLTILTTYLLGKDLFGEQVGLLAAGLAALNGLLIAFARIVQYQQLVVWMSLLSVLCAWQWRKDGKKEWWILVGLFLGVGVLSHYDAILVIPVLIYIFFLGRKFSQTNITALLFAGVSFILVAGLFFIPYFLNPQVARTGEYLGQRVGSSIFHNNLDIFFHINIFYNSFYYFLIIGGLALGYVVWTITHLHWIQRLPGGRYLVSAIIIIGVVGLALKPNALSFFNIDWAFFVFGLILIASFFSPVVTFEQRVIILWFVVSFWGYNFVVASPRTHFYTILPSLILLTSLSAAWLWNRLAFGKGHYFVPLVGSVFLALLFGGYLYNAYLRYGIYFEVDWPESRPAIYWTPYSTIPNYDAYGFMHKDGWKAIGGLYNEGLLEGEYHTNGRHPIADWYTRNELRHECDNAKYFFGLRYRLVDPAELMHYEQIGKIDLGSNKGMNIFQIQPVSNNLEFPTVDKLNDAFDYTATPSAFVRPASERHSADITLADAIRLVSYEIKPSYIQASDRIAVTLNWKMERYLPLDADVFVHLVDEGDESSIWGQSNGTPSCGKHPTSTWQVGQVIEDRHIVVIDPDTPSGEYLLTAGMYLPESNQRAPILDETRQPVSTAIELSKITIE